MGVYLRLLFFKTSEKVRKLIVLSNSRHLASGKRASDSKVVQTVTGHFGQYHRIIE